MSFMKIASSFVLLTAPFSSCLSTQTQQAFEQQTYIFELPPLPYAYNALDAYIDAETMEIHHSKHHKAYVDNLNKGVQGTEWATMPLQQLFSHTDTLPVAIRNNAGGHWNHSFFWLCMTPIKEKRTMSPAFEEMLVNQFGSIDQFKKEFIQAGLTRFGSGWSWLIQKDDGTLAICSTENQDNPLMNTSTLQGTPLLCCDVWEHAYYLRYQNRRDLYINEFWNIVNWEFVEGNLKK